MSPIMYAAKAGIVCPVCAGDEIEGGSFDISAGIAQQEVRCVNCGSSWMDTFRLIGYDCLNVGGGDDS